MSKTNTRAQPNSKGKATGVDQRVLRSLAHPLRLRILHALNADVRSPSELAEEFGELLPNVSYHVKILLDNEAIELVRTQPVRGALQHFYRATMRPRMDDDLFAALPTSSRRAIAAEGLDTIWEEVAAAASGEGFDDPRTHISMTRLELDHEALDQLQDHLIETIDLAMRLDAESRERQEAGHAPTHPTQLVQLHFNRVEGKPTRADRARHRKRAPKSG